MSDTLELEMELGISNIVLQADEFEPNVNKAKLQKENR
jgi:hypothetical protein